MLLSAGFDRHPVDPGRQGEVLKVLILMLDVPLT